MAVQYRNPNLGGAFEEVSLITTQALLVTSQAVEKRGKTHWAFTAPSPIYCISTDTGTEEVASKFVAQGKSIKILRCQTPKELDGKDEAVAEWERIKKGWYSVVEDRTARTLVIDTHTELWQTLRLARFGKLEQVPPKKYDEVNSEMRAMVKAIKARRNLNAVFIHKYKKEYVGSKKPDGSAGMDSWTGGYERQGFGDMGFLSDVVIEHGFCVPGTAKAQSNKRAVNLLPDEVIEQLVEKQFYVRVIDTRFNMTEAIGQVLVGSAADFLGLAMMILPDSDPELWI